MRRNTSCKIAASAMTATPSALQVRQILPATVMLLMVLRGGVVTAFIVHRMVVLMVVLQNVPCVQLSRAGRNSQMQG